MVRRCVVLGLLCFAATAQVATASREGDPGVAALQVALRRHHVYRGPVNGRLGTTTEAAVRRLQAHEHLVVDGIVGPRTRRALGRFARHPLGSRVLRRGSAGWDVAELQFRLAWAGFPSGAFDGRFGWHVLRALRTFQREHGLRADGVAGGRTLAALRLPPPDPRLLLAWPLIAPVGDRFGPRGDRFHAGIDLPAPEGAPVAAAAPGRVVWAGPRDGYGLLVTIAHAAGIRTLYAHLSAIDVHLGEIVAGGALIGRVGATGDATGPHLHFEVRDRGAAVDPLAELVPR